MYRCKKACVFLDNQMFSAHIVPNSTSREPTGNSPDEALWIYGDDESDGSDLDDSQSDTLFLSISERGFFPFQLPSLSQPLP